MSSSVHVDSSVQATPLHSPTIERKQTTTPSRKNIREDYSSYEVGVLLFTQLSYIPTTCTMLSTSFYEPTKEYCDRSRSSNETDISKLMGDTDFHSVLMDWDLACQETVVYPIVTTAFMLGALIGSVVAGWLADTYGRKPVTRGSLFAMCIGNVIFSLLANIWWPLAAFVLFGLGAACGGFMVTNLVLLVECLESSQSRLLAVSLNGFSVSMAVTALFARITRHWLSFHLLTAGSALIFAIIGHMVTVESCRWLASVHRVSEARANAEVIARKNGFPISPDATWYELLGLSAPQTNQTSPEQTTSNMPKKEYGYMDLYKNPTIFYPLCALCYCFTVSSTVSFGFYFNPLPGDRYWNLGLMGIGKFILVSTRLLSNGIVIKTVRCTIGRLHYPIYGGTIPFLLSPLNIGRRPIVLWSVGVSAAASLAILITQFSDVGMEHWSLTALPLLIAATMDPTWKINHLYSTELFPTAIRNRARGVCNGGSRLGTVVTPFLVYLRSVHYMLPYIIFAVLLTGQWFVVLGYLPETKNKPLPDDFKPTEEESNAISETNTLFTEEDEILRIELGAVDSDKAILEV